jgi:magnesium and cobalt transporter
MSDTSGKSKSWLEQLGSAFAPEPKDLDQLIDILREAQQRDLMDADVLAMLESALQLSDMRVREIQIPTTQMTSVNETQSLEHVVNVANECGFSRLPLFDEEDEKILGIVFVKDLLGVCLSDANAKESFDLKKIIRPAYFVPESKRLDSLLREFRATHNHMGVVINEYGNVSGLVTIEDVLEQIVGDIEDEHDVDEEEANIRAHGDSYIIKSITPVEDFNAYFDVSLHMENFDSIGGIVLNAFGYLPKRGEKVVVDNMQFTILHADKRRLRVLGMTLLDNDSNAQ